MTLFLLVIAAGLIGAFVGYHMGVVDEKERASGLGPY